MANSSLNPKTKLAVALLLGGVVTLVTGVVCGKVSQRWGPAADLVAAGEHLKTLPTEIGSWRLVAEDTMTPTTIATLQCSGYVNRRYVDQETGDTVNLAIIAGPPGPISVHTPEICYSSRDYTMAGERERTILNDRGQTPHTFWRMKFRANNAIGEQLRVYYGWRAGRNWAATDSPRFEFAGAPLLFKLQLASSVPPTEKDNATDPGQKFLQALLESGWKIDG